MKVLINALDHNGRGITKIDGKTCFVKNSLINEEVEIKVIKDKKKFIEAESTKILVPSCDRVLEKCKYASVCGGCNIMHMSYKAQVNYKKEKIINIFKRFCNLDINIDEFIESDSLFYRNKINFNVDNKIGLYVESTNKIIEVDECVICNEKINEIYQKIKNINLCGINKIVIRIGENTNETMVVLNLIKDINIKEFENLLKPFINTLVIRKNNEYKTIFGNGFIYEKLGDLIFKISPDSFFQVNTKQALKLYSKVKEYLGSSNNVLDLYCGTGTIGMFVSDVCKKVTGIEINKYAVEDALENKILNKIEKINFICEDSKKYLEKNNNKFDAVIVDPPRSGLNKNMIDDLFKINAEKIIYVSCDPITLARDLNDLLKVYKLNKISLVDMFPNTSHVESVCILKCK